MWWSSSFVLCSMVQLSWTISTMMSLPYSMIRRDHRISSFLGTRRQRRHHSKFGWKLYHQKSQQRPIQTIPKSASFLSMSSASNSVTESMRLESLHQMQLLESFYQQHGLSSSSASSSSTSSQCFVPQLLTTVEQATHYRIHQHNIQVVLLDCDGVVYRTLDVTPRAASCIESLLQSQPFPTQIYFVTNNASTNRVELRNKLQQMLFPIASSSTATTTTTTLTTEMMIPTSYVAAQYLKQELLGTRQLHSEKKSSSSHHHDTHDDDPPRMVVHVIGSSGLCQEMEQAGLLVSMGHDEPHHSMTRDELAAYPFHQNHPSRIDAMVVGLDTKFSFRKLCIANVLLQRHPHALCVATNMDTHDLVGKDGRHLPGNGSIVSCLAYASQRSFINVGKPSLHLAQLVLSHIITKHPMVQPYKTPNDNDQSTTTLVDPSHCLMVGDRLDTDIAFAKNCGMKSALVLTGVTTAQDIIDIILKKQEQHQLTSNNDMVDNSCLPDVILPYLGLLA